MLSMHAKYETSIPYGSKVMAKVKVFATHRQIGQKLDAPIPFWRQNYIFKYYDINLKHYVLLHAADRLSTKLKFSNSMCL